MIFIGTDIINLKSQPNKNIFISKRYLNKSYSAEEQNRIVGSENLMKELWKIWSCKEAAYKVLAKLQKGLIFKPKDLKVNYTKNEQAEVRYGKVQISLYSIVNDSYVLTTATNKNVDNKKISTFIRYKNEDTESKDVRKLLLENIGLVNAKIKMDRFGIPRLYLGDRKLNYDISLSHDYGLLAASFIPGESNGIKSFP